MPVTERLVLDQGLRQNKQSIHQTMKKGWNRCPTQKTKVMERMTPLERWNGLAWVCTTWLWKGGMDLLGSVWNGYGKVLLVVEEKGVLGPQCSPKHNAFDSSGGSLCGCDLTTSISSTGMQGQANEKSARAHKQTTCPGNHPRSTPPADVSRNVRHVLEDSSGDGYRRPGEWGLSPKKVTKEANQQDVSW